MLHACVQRFDVMDTIGKFLATKQALVKSRRNGLELMFSD